MCFCPHKTAICATVEAVFAMSTEFKFVTLVYAVSCVLPPVNKTQARVKDSYCIIINTDCSIFKVTSLKLF